MDTKRRSKSNPSASPEFEFWMVRNPSFPQPNILSADQLIVNGVLLPLHLVNKPHPSPSPSTTTTTTSKRWKDIFRKKNEAQEKKKEKEKKGSVGTGASPELNININLWPFSRSRSAGTHPKVAPPSTRKANSAPCSRSNSARKWPSSPGRPGVHLGRSSPVWQVRRPKNPEAEKPKRRSPKSRVLNLNVPMCMGYKHHFSCRSPVEGAGGIRAFNLRTLFTKKTVLTSH
uniref:Uncharacterized protein n=2 Tax=Cajanus cajan TaxID=3821 RepID=A0A151SU09_CAJCA|nr:hypothetical protein KK1_004574 [Cajanus cajan]